MSYLDWLQVAQISDLSERIEKLEAEVANLTEWIRYLHREQQKREDDNK